MRQYEITFIVDPVLSGDEIKAAADNYVSMLKGEGSEIVHIDEMGLRQLAYPIKRRHSGIYFCVEFQNETGDFIEKVELAMRRDERIIRFLTVKLDKYGVKYNEDKRNGLITPYKVKRDAIRKAKEEKRKNRRDRRRHNDDKRRKRQAEKSASAENKTTEKPKTSE